MEKTKKLKKYLSKVTSWCRMKRNLRRKGGYQGMERNETAKTIAVVREREREQENRENLFCF